MAIERVLVAIKGGKQRREKNGVKGGGRWGEGKNIVVAKNLLVAM